MDITLDQARVLETVVRQGTIQKAADELNRTHTAIIYSLKCLEQSTELTLFSRAGRRNQLSAEGEMVLKFCRKLLETSRELAHSCQQVKSGWEPTLKLVYDEVVDFNNIGSALYDLNKLRPPTEVKILSAHLNDVEDLFAREAADLMVTILPLQKLQIKSRKLKPIEMFLVAHKDHPLAGARREKISSELLQGHTFITITTAGSRLGFGTEHIKFDSYFFVNSFENKKMAVLNRLGIGWLPDYLIRPELKKGTLVKLKTEFDNTHVLSPHLYYRSEEMLGVAARQLSRALV